MLLAQSYKKCFDFHGRADRKEFFLYLAYAIMIAAAAIFSFNHAGATTHHGQTILFTTIGYMALIAILPMTSLIVRRLHDHNRTGCWCLIVLAPFIGWLVLFIMCCLPGKVQKNRYDAAPTSISKHIKFAIVAIYQSYTTKYCVFSSRANRSEYWLFILNYFIIAYALIMLAGGPTQNLMDSNNYPFILFTVYSIIPYLAVQIRRLHDINQSAWLLLIALIPVLGSIMMLIVSLCPGTERPNRFDGAEHNHVVHQ